MPDRIPASLTYLVGTALLAGGVCAGFSYLAARILGLSTVIAPVVSGGVAAGLVGYFIHRDGLPTEEPHL